jgi:serine/threonine-protein kinase
MDGHSLAVLDTDPLIGQTLEGRYFIEECIGEGGMGRVYRARHTRMSRGYAVKVLFGDHAGDSRMRTRFEREAEGVARLSHPNIVSVVDFGETSEGLLFLVMDLAIGTPLSQYMSRNGPMPQEQAVSITKQLCLGLAHAHDRGLVHRDFKGENVILVDQDGRTVPKIVDFGICMIVEDSPMTSMLTSNGMIMGTPAVMSPEQATGDTVDHRSDLFSLGIVMYQMLTGRLPFDGSPLDMARKNLYETIPSMAERGGVNVHPRLEVIVGHLVEKRPENRYQSAHEVLHDLQQLDIADEPLSNLGAVNRSSWDMESAKTEIKLDTPGASLSQAIPGLSVSAATAAPLRAATAAPSQAAPARQLSLPTAQVGELSPKKSRRRGMMGLAIVAAASAGAVIWALSASGDKETAPAAAEAQAAAPPTGSPVPGEPEPPEEQSEEPVQEAGADPAVESEEAKGKALATGQPDDNAAAKPDEGTMAKPDEKAAAARQTSPKSKQSTRSKRGRQSGHKRNKTPPKPAPTQSESLTPDRISSLVKGISRRLSRLKSKGVDVSAIEGDFLALPFSHMSSNDISKRTRLYTKLRRIETRLRKVD